MKSWKEILAYMLVILHLTSLPGLCFERGGSSKPLPPPRDPARDNNSPQSRKNDSTPDSAGIRLPGNVLPGHRRSSSLCRLHPARMIENR